MISGLIDELNKSADEWNGSNMFELARMCRNAADTICELRGALQVASVDYRHLSEENAKLRESVKRLMTQRDERLARAETDNAKLRELVREAIYARDDADWASIVSTAIALGIEVDDGVS